MELRAALEQPHPRQGGSGPRDGPEQAAVGILSPFPGGLGAEGEGSGVC